MASGVETLPFPVDVRDDSGSLPVGRSLQYQGQRGLVWLLIKNLLLGVVTLGLYRFWARTALRRYFWSATTIDGEPLEYTGRGSELFIGFLVVMAIFVPITIVYYIVQTMLVANEAVLGGLDVFYFIAITLLIAAGQYRARRYRLSRTVWRGIRAAQDGSTWIYVGRYALWAVAFLLTLGLAAPWAATDLARYRIEHTLWGDQRGDFRGRATGLLAPWLTCWLLLMLPLLMAVAVTTPTIVNMGFDGDIWNSFKIATADFSQAARTALVIIAILSWLLLPSAYIRFTFCWLRWYAGGTSIGFLTLSAHFSPGRLTLRVILSYLLAMMLLAFVVAAAVVLAGGGISLSKLSTGSPSVSVMLAGFGAFAAVYIFGGIITTLLITVPVLRRIIEGISVAGLDRVDAVMQSSQSMDRTGEGLADSFDIGIG